MKARLLKAVSTYLKEFIIITIGVTIAFWVENYREIRKELNDTKALLGKVKSDLQAQDEYLKFIYEYANIHALRFDSVVTDLKDGGIELNQLIIDMSIAYRPYIADVSQTSAFESLKSSGLLSNIQNDSLITAIYDIETRIKTNLLAYNEEWKKCQDRLREQISPIYGNQIRYDFAQSKLLFTNNTPVIVSGASRDRITFEIIAWITIMKQYSLFVKRHQEQINEILPMIDRELR